MAEGLRVTTVGAIVEQAGQRLVVTTVGAIIEMELSRLIVTTVGVIVEMIAAPTGDVDVATPASMELSAPTPAVPSSLNIYVPSAPMMWLLTPAPEITGTDAAILRIPYDTASDLDANTPLQRELVYDTTNDEVRYGDGSTAGGVPLPLIRRPSATLRLITDSTGVVALGSDSSTHERGMLVKMINRTGGSSVKGTLVSCSTSADREAIKQANEYDTIGVVQEAGVAEGSEMWVWVTGSVCQVLYKDSTAATHGNILIAADTDGRAIDVANPGGGLPGTETHFKECGHVMESKEAGTNVLVLAMLHFN